MKMEFIVLGKNFYSMPDNQGANLIILGDYEETSHKAGLSVSEASIDFNEHLNIKEFPAVYQANAKLTSIKQQSGKIRTGLKLENIELKNKVEIKDVKNK